MNCKKTDSELNFFNSTHFNDIIPEARQAFERHTVRTIPRIVC